MSTRRIRFFQFRLSSLLVFVTCCAFLCAWFVNSRRVALDGNCVVTLCEQHRWLPGSSKFAEKYQGLTYHFSGERELREFKKTPAKYAIGFQGYDPVVLALEKQRRVSGDRKYGIFYQETVVVFASEASLRRFEKSPNSYINQATKMLKQ